MQSAYTIHQVRGNISNSYVVEEGEDLIVFDVGFNETKFVLGFIHDELEKEFEAIKLIVVTHKDFDHYGGVKSLTEKSKAEICYPKKSLDEVFGIVSNPIHQMTRMFTATREMMRPRSWGLSSNSSDKKDKPIYDNASLGFSFKEVLFPNYDHLVEDGDTLPYFSHWQAIATPGHSDDSFSFFNTQNKVLITGDAVLTSASREISVLPSIYANARQMEQSQEKLLALEPSFVCPGHGPILEGLVFEE